MRFSYCASASIAFQSKGSNNSKKSGAKSFNAVDVTVVLRTNSLLGCALRMNPGCKWSGVCRRD